MLPLLLLVVWVLHAYATDSMPRDYLSPFNPYAKRLGKYIGKYLLGIFPWLLQLFAEFFVDFGKAFSEEIADIDTIIKFPKINVPNFDLGLGSGGLGILGL